MDQYSDRNIYRDSIIIGKVHESIEDPLSNVFYNISDKIAPALKYIDITPNQITTIRFSLLLLAILYCIPRKMYKIASVLYILSYFGDCLDGLYSRKYNMVTSFGDYYDHIADYISMVLTFYILYSTVNSSHKWIVHLLVIMILLSLIQIGCQERYIDMMKLSIDYTSPSISKVTCLCPQSIVKDTDVEYLMEYTRLFGAGTAQLFITILIWNLDAIE